VSVRTLNFLRKGQKRWSPPIVGYCAFCLCLNNMLTKARNPCNALNIEVLNLKPFIHSFIHSFRSLDTSFDLQIYYVLHSVFSDPVSLIPDPDLDPAFEAEYRSGSGSRVLVTKSWEKNLQLDFFFFFQKSQFTYPQASINDVQATEKAFNPQKRTSSPS
jgi:hypothetical protein